MNVSASNSRLTSSIFLSSSPAPPTTTIRLVSKLIANRAETTLWIWILPQSANADGIWAHDKFMDVGPRTRSGGMGAAGARGGAKLVIGNLHYAVSEADLRVWNEV